MRLRLILPWLSVCLCLATAALGDPAMADPKALESVYGTLSAADAVEAPRVLQDSAGFLRYLGAPPGKSFWTSAAVAKAGDPEAVAYEFLGVHGGAFAAASDCGAFRTDRVGADANRSYVRLQQVYDGLDVFGAQMIVQVNGEGGIESVLSDIMRDPGVFDSGEVTTSPGISASAAKIAAIAFVALESPTHDEADLMVTAGPDLMVYDPAVAGAKGPKRLVWKMTVSSPFDLELEKEVLVDAHTAEVVLAYSNVFTAKNREIYDANNTYDDPGELERSEGDPPSRIEDANLAYDYYGDTYDFYFNHHNRDSIDNLGMTMSATVRSCSIYYPYCPLPNAFWMPTSKRMYFGDGIVVDDVVGHELTHGVTQYESNLMYLGESGAISECFSDVWGEFVDLTNGRGDDSSSVRWLIGEELPKILNPDGRGLRNMADPTEFQNPDKMSSPYWIPPTWYWYDNGGVHSNGGVGNKMVYLLTDGDSFNGYSIAPLAQDSDESIDRVAKLMYELQTHLLGPASDYNDMYMQLSQATMNLDYTFNERMNVSAAGKAVEINPKSTTGELKRFRATPVYTVAGDPAIALTWENPQTAQFDSVSIVRSTDRFPNDPTDGTLVYEGKESLALDEDVLKGVTYYYGAFANFRTDFPQVVYARALAGTDAPSTMTEAFAVDIFGNAGGEIDFAKMIDLRYCQLTFTPVGAPSFPLGTDQDFADYTNYEATIKKGVEKLPVARTDAQGGAVSVDLANNTQIGFILDDPIPFFGKPYYQFMLAANGYVSFKGVSSTSVNNFPTLAAHYAIPRISFLFGLLSPSSGGDIWVRDLDDRVVVTFEKVPEFIELDSPISPWPTSPWPNTVQLEMFYNGQIRITYQDVMITNVICGLSDGNGVPLDLSEAFEDLAPLEETVDLSELPEVQVKLSIDPVTPVWAYAG
ncbi:MAG: Dockerin protein, partial [Candidatus Hydrogenedentes bacterium]|nr:Dockerin protein [Candidatus Hydrogenedentota bacterium]